MRIIDADGHVVERQDYHEELSRYMPKGYQNRPVFPQLSPTRHYMLGDRPRGRRSGKNPGPEEWLAFMDTVGIEQSVVYPTVGLGVGRLVDEDWAIAACHAWNDWLYDRFLSATDRVKGVALIPVQDPEAAAREMERGVTELGMLGAVLPTASEGIKGHYGSSIYWPVYQAAEELGCPLAVHGGCHIGIGMDHLTQYPTSALGHPIGVMIEAAAMLSCGIMERFPALRVAFLEAGATWVPTYLDRMDHAYDEPTFSEDGDADRFGGPMPGEKPSQHFLRYVAGGRIVIGLDGNDEGLGYAVQRVGRGAFVYASDFTHGSTDPKPYQAEIREFMMREDLAEEDKEAIFAGNAERFYGLER
jgi:predicted TIM-barrel fold metal-dependent hydrolase